MTRTSRWGQGAGFYVNATETPWAPHFRMWDYVTDELPRLLFNAFPLAEEAQGITGHSMGGHGALTIAMSFPGAVRSVSAFAPICNPVASDWGRRNFLPISAPMIRQLGRRMMPPC
jgi:S-formylglutathione hydrolase